MATRNQFGQPIGDGMDSWAGARRPERATLRGEWCTLEPLEPARHATSLYDAYASADDDSDWTYLPIGPFRDFDSYRAWVTLAVQAPDPLHFAIVDNGTGQALGSMALMRQDPDNGVGEVGWVTYSRALQRTAIATEAQALLMRYVFEELGYRRYEWKCDSLNEPSRKAALRLGFTYEGTFRQAAVTKGRNRDTAWFSLLDSEWPRVREALDAWLDPANFDTEGQQLQPLRVR